MLQEHLIVADLQTNGLCVCVCVIEVSRSRSDQSIVDGSIESAISSNDLNHIGYFSAQPKLMQFSNNETELESFEKSRFWLRITNTRRARAYTIGNTHSMYVHYCAVGYMKFTCCFLLLSFTVHFCRCILLYFMYSQVNWLYF